MQKSIGIFNGILSVFNSIKNRYDSDWLITNATLVNSDPVETNASLSLKDLEYYIEKHQHSCFEMCLCCEGKCSLEIMDKIVELGQGMVCLILPETIHNELAQKGERYLAIWVSFDSKVIKIHLSGKDVDNRYYTTDYIVLEIEYILYHIILSDIEKDSQGLTKWSIDSIKTSVLQLLIIILKNLGKESEKPSSIDGWQQSVVREVVSYIENNHNKNIALSEISQHVAISMNYLNNIFKTVTGTTIINYVNNYKILKVKEYLENTNLMIKDIASLLGYYDQYHLSKAFKRCTGLSPTKYRTEKQKDRKNYNSPS